MSSSPCTAPEALCMPVMPCHRHSMVLLVFACTPLDHLVWLVLPHRLIQNQWVCRHDCNIIFVPTLGWPKQCTHVTLSSGYRQQPCPATAVHAMQFQAGMFPPHSELLAVIVIQWPGSCNMTTSLVADDPNSYNVMMCSSRYYGPLCSLCLLHNAPPGGPRYGRTGTLNCQPCRSAS